jgi:hypothetical protein
MWYLHFSKMNCWCLFRPRLPSSELGIWKAFCELVVSLFYGTQFVGNSMCASTAWSSEKMESLWAEDIDLQVWMLPGRRTRGGASTLAGQKIDEWGWSSVLKWIHDHPKFLQSTLPWHKHTCSRVALLWACAYRHTLGGWISGTSFKGDAILSLWPGCESKRLSYIMDG